MDESQAKDGKSKITEAPFIHTSKTKAKAAQSMYAQKGDFANPNLIREIQQQHRMTRQQVRADNGRILLKDRA